MGKPFKKLLNPYFYYYGFSALLINQEEGIKCETEKMMTEVMGAVL